ncbi:MAG: hypothetical protein JWO14_927 [Solirubrobacterales bacterium]|nr:hypothetical protein [Solirubrobacterales bacterium]
MHLGSTLEPEREGTETLQSERTPQPGTHHGVDSVHLVSGSETKHRPGVTGSEWPASRRAARATLLDPIALNQPTPTDLLSRKATVRSQQPHTRGTKPQCIRSVGNGDQWSYHRRHGNNYSANAIVTLIVAITQ